MDKISGVYKIKNILNGHCYIGSAVDIKKRWRDHKNCLRNNNHRNAHLQNARNKYGEDSFKFNILLICDKENNILYEQMCIDGMKPEYNISPTAGSQLGMKHTKETKRKMAIAKTGKHRTEETKRKMSESAKAYHKSNPEVRLGENNPNFGKHHSAETRRKISISKVGKRMSEKARKNMSIARTGRTFSKEHRAKLSVATTAYWKRVKETRRFPNLKGMI